MKINKVVLNLKIDIIFHKQIEMQKKMIWQKVKFKI
jgi:hypothetical protein